MCHFPTKMLPTLCREFSNSVCLVFWRILAVAESVPPQVPTTVYDKKNDVCSREIRWKWCYFEQKVLLKPFVWYQTSQELSSTVIYFSQNSIDLWGFGPSVPSDSITQRYVSNRDEWRLPEFLNCLFATRYRSVGQHFTLSIHAIVFFMLKWKIQ